MDGVFGFWTILVLLLFGTQLTSGATFECPSRFGYFPDKTECAKYYICNFGFGVQQECPNGLQFSTRLRNCDWARNINCTQYNGYAYREGEDNLPPDTTEVSTTPELFIFPLNNTRFTQIFAQTTQRTGITKKPKLQICPAPLCTKSNCQAPGCRCGSADPPNVMDPDDIPQMILVTFENAITDWAMSVSENTFTDARKNPNNCPIRATYFVSHEWTDYSNVQNLLTKGHEIAVLGISLEFKNNRSLESWEAETQGQRKILSKFANIPMTDIVGMRAPYLSIGGDNQFMMLYNNEFLYDSSMPVFESEPPFFPFTLDCRINNDCMIDPCPNNSFPGIWEMPIVMWNDLSGSRCNMVDQCTDAENYQEVYELLMSNFERHYTTNRAPFNIFVSAGWFAKEMNQRAFRGFLDTVLDKTDQAKYRDVYFVTMSQAIQWMKTPVTRFNAKTFKPWQCTDTPKTPPCTKPNQCTPWFEKNKEIRPFKTCRECPKNYPWVGNEDGH
ncbi:LOW QUALITY PROTEIN: chitin deacetylase 1-like [Paramacrobiotus metropolitanus]|uniref:LOW QUALITY PROTEIN: chitin deacetylase 1-like n=1 Tax=Paramacrobiotus metropolitanus TaxID=2943436 RepID=UPI00244565DD|nr:LOW QUALITY PROTEIN: chitin deacetylase 1-like [Paramacrobiotus metropolitanus]